MVEMTEYAAGTPSWVDVMTPDLDATKAFYGGLFGWAAETHPEMGNYTNFTLNGKIVCGANPMMSPEQHPAWTTFIATDDADATAQAVRDNGGQVALAPMDVMELGRMAVFADPTGAYFGVWQAGQHTGAQLANEPGAFIWNQLDTRDIAAAKAFYTKVFSWTAEDGTQWQWHLGGRPVGSGMQIDENYSPDVPPNWLTYFAVADSDTTAAKVKELGGSVVMPGMDIEFGRIAVFRDPHGAAFATIQMKQ